MNHDMLENKVLINRSSQIILGHAYTQSTPDDTVMYVQGALLMVLFEGSHVLEHRLTDQAQGNLQALFDATPEHATLVELKPDKSPDMAKLQSAKARDVAVGSHMLIRPGEQVSQPQSLLSMPSTSASVCRALLRVQTCAAQLFQVSVAPARHMMLAPMSMCVQH